MFREDAKRFYRELRKKTIQTEKLPDIGEVKKFWQNILEQEVKHNEDAQWIEDQEEKLQQINQMEWKDLTGDDLRVNMTRTANGKSSGPDRLPNFRIKQFKSLHNPMAEAYSEIIKDLKQTHSRLSSRRSHQPTTYKGRKMELQELQANSMSANHLQDPDISHHR